VEKLRDQVYDSQKINKGFPFRVIDIGLNSILQRANLDLLALLDQFGMKSECRELEDRIQLTHSAIGNLWDQEFESFFSLDEITGESIQVSTSACFLPLFAGLGTGSEDGLNPGKLVGSGLPSGSIDFSRSSKIRIPTLLARSGLASCQLDDQRRIEKLWS
jgi:hypothetical protein